MRRWRVGGAACASKTCGEGVAGVRTKVRMPSGPGMRTFVRTPASPPAASRRAYPRPVRATVLLAALLIGMATLGFTMAGGSAAGPISSTDAAPVLLIHTGEQRGHLEPCGCTQPQIGGL